MRLNQKKEPRLRYLIGWNIGLIAKFIYKTLDFELIIAEEHRQHPKQQVIYGIWHNRIMVSTLSYIEFMNRLGINSNLYALTSASKDGEIIEGLMAVNGVKTIRGSSHKKSKAAGLEIYKMLKNNKNICITPDGPTGPIYQFKPGLIKIAAKAQVPILPVKVEYSDYWELRTWDKFRIPRPFSKVKVTYGELQWIPQDYDEASESNKIAASLG